MYKRIHTWVGVRYFGTEWYTRCFIATILPWYLRRERCDQCPALLFLRSLAQPFQFSVHPFALLLHLAQGLLIRLDERVDKERESRQKKTPGIPFYVKRKIIPTYTMIHLRYQTSLWV